MRKCLCDLLGQLMTFACTPNVRTIFRVKIGEQTGPVAKTPQFLGPKPKGRYQVMIVLITSSQYVLLTPKFVDKKGNPAPVQNQTWGTDNTDVVALTVGTVAEDGTFTADEAGISCRVDALGPLGAANVTLKADADLGEGETPIFGTATVQVGPGSATSVELVASAPAEQE